MGARACSLAVPFFCMVVVALSACTSTATVPNPPSTSLVTTSAIDAIAQPLIESGTLPSLVVGIGNGNGIIFAKAYGQRSLSPMAAALTTTPYWIASVTKQFTAAAILLLKEDGKLSLDDPLSKYVAEYTPASQMTLRQVLSMSAGIVGEQHGEDRIFNDNLLAPITAAQVLANLNAIPLFAPPGTQFDYANAGYYMLGLVIERVSSTDYASFLAQRIFGPLGMTSTYIEGSKVDPTAAIGYIHEQPPDPFLACPDFDPSVAFSAGELVSTVGDLLTWDAALRSGRVLDASDVRTMTTASGLPVTGLGSLDDSSYGLGWFVGPNNLVHHSGDTVLFHSENALFPDGYNVVLLTNGQNARPVWDSLDVAVRIHNTLFGASAFPSRPPLPASTPGPVASSCSAEPTPSPAPLDP